MKKKNRPILGDYQLATKTGGKLSDIRQSNELPQQRLEVSAPAPSTATDSYQSQTEHPRRKAELLPVSGQRNCESNASPSKLVGFPTTCSDTHQQNC